MHVIRPIQASDIDSLEEIAMSATLGLTSLPKNREKLEQKLAHAIKSFESTLTQPEDELYIFVLEDTETGTVGGTTGIVSKIGVETPAHFFRLETIRHAESETLPELKILRPVAYIDGPTEIGSLFLVKEFRHGGLGKLLSFCRFLFMASHPERFERTTIAEMRGVINKDFTSPLWNALGEHFFNASFEKAMMLRDQGFFNLNDVIPEYPIYTSVLTQAAQNVIGKVHQNTKPALKMLKELGFKKTDEIDLFDGGPKIEADTSEIKAVRNSIAATVGKIEQEVEGSEAIISNTRLNFRACEGVVSKRKAGKVTIAAKVADALQVDVGDTIRYYKVGR